MRRNAPPKRRAPGRIAAATVGALGASLLTPPLSVGAQEEIDCAALGDDPIRGTVERALEAAVACDIEVRVDQRAWPHSTLYAMPEGRLHLVSTAEAVQEYRDEGAFDATLTEWDGGLVQTATQWDIWLPHTDGGSYVLHTSDTALGWNEAMPVPSYSGTTAVYDEIAAGLDLTVDVGIASADLVFTVDDAEAWDALATGLSVFSGHDPSVVDGTVRIDDPGYPDHQTAVSQWTTPFAVHDAEGAVTTAHLDLDAEGAITMSLPEGPPAMAAYPLTVATQWVLRAFPLSEWGSVTSAAPGLSVFQGEAGMTEPYFEAAGEHGDALVGSYCDALADSECSITHEAATYWSFMSPQLREKEPAGGGDFAFPVSSAAFRVDAAEGTSCTAPDLHLTEDYSPAATDTGRPAVIGATASGSCEDGTAVYDVTEAAGQAWSDPDVETPIAFGMTESAETARFDGGSARLDVYFDVISFRFYPTEGELCSWDASSPSFATSATPKIGNFKVSLWRADLVDLGLTWTAVFHDAATGQERAVTDPVAVRTASNTRVLEESEAVADGSYEVVYVLSSSTTDFEYRSDPCRLVVDASRPEAVDIAVEPGQHYVGDTVTVHFTVTDEGFPGEGRSLTVKCSGWVDCVSDEPIVLTESGSGSFEVELVRPDGYVSLEIRDESSNVAYTDDLPIPATRSQRDYDGDRRQDLIAVRESDGALLFHAGRGDGTYEEPVSLGTGWGGTDVVMAGDLTGDGLPDLLARDTATGRLYTHPGDGEGGLDARMQVGTGWNSIGAFTSAGDFDEDGHLDIIAARKTDGALYLYPGRGDGTFGSASLARGGGAPVDSLVAVGGYFYTGEYELLVRNIASGDYSYYLGSGDGTFPYQHMIGEPLDTDGEAARFGQTVMAGDTDGDGYDDLVAVDSATRALVRLSLENVAFGTPMEVDQIIDGDWGGVRLPGVSADGAYDYDGDGYTDVAARGASDGVLYRYGGYGDGAFGWSDWWDTGWGSMDLIAHAGDTDGDGRADLLARNRSTGKLYLYTGDGQGGLERLEVGGSWGAMSSLVSGHDYDGDGVVDILARESSTGYLWLYPGDGDGTVGERRRIGTGWNAMREITAVGDLDHDGRADLIAARTSNGCLYFYPGTASGLGGATSIGCGWGSMDQLTGIGDFDGDGHIDWVARRPSDGRLFLYPGDGRGDAGSSVIVGTGWNALDVLA